MIESEQISINGLTTFQSFMKRSFDVLLSIIGLISLFWLIFIAWLVASIETKENGFFRQKRVGKGGLSFRVIKIRTMCTDPSIDTTVTAYGDQRITKIGYFWRRTKIDELPQLINVLLGDMSFVGPRPDVPGFADLLNNNDKVLLSVRPGITGPATLKYRDEEKLLADQDNPEHYNKSVIWPDKVQINLDYIQSWSLKKDVCYILKTVMGVFN